MSSEEGGEERVAFQPWPTQHWEILKRELGVRYGRYGKHKSTVSVVPLVGLADA